LTFLFFCRYTLEAATKIYYIKEEVMKKQLLGITVLAIVLFASSAIAQVGSNAIAPLPPLAQLGPIVGKTVSVYSYTGAAFNVGTSDTTVVSAPVPSKYKSKNQWLIAHVTLQENCTGSYIVGGAWVDGINMYPTDTSRSYYQCADNANFEPRHITFFLPPESLGGPAITLGATVSVTVRSPDGTPIIGHHSIVIQAVK
jgi:hypothetical protein